MDTPDAPTRVTFVDGRATELRLRRFRLEIVAGADAGKSEDFSVASVRVGGRPPADFVLADERVSGLHFEVRLDEHGFRLLDLGSTNGTFVAGVRVNDVYLRAPALVEAGDSRVRLVSLADSVEVPLSAGDRFGPLVGASVVMRALFARLERLAAVDTTVLVTGETGTGKDLVAEAIHLASPRRAQPFEIVDCGAVAPNLIESALFGHARGAFTGAATAQAGAFERAHGGTLFLDEIGELPLDLQPRLLRAVEHRQVRRLGASEPVAVDVRVVAATNRDLALEVSRGRFREDLYFRLAVAHLHLPPLRERKEDLPLLVEHLLSTMGGAGFLSPRTLELLAKHDWPGNVRELRNALERAARLGETPVDTGELGVLSPERAASAPADDPVSVPIDLDRPFKDHKQQVVEAFERAYVSALVRRHGGNVSAAARAAGLDRMSLYKILTRLGLRRQSTLVDDE
jgi:DNA-binding NtrC family response regulator